jgi:hypothetical protein
MAFKILSLLAFAALAATGISAICVNYGYLETRFMFDLSAFAGLLFGTAGIFLGFLEETR